MDTDSISSFFDACATRALKERVGEHLSDMSLPIPHNLSGTDRVWRLYINAQHVTAQRCALSLELFIAITTVAIANTAHAF